MVEPEKAFRPPQVQASDLSSLGRESPTVQAAAPGRSSGGSVAYMSVLCFIALRRKPWDSVGNGAN